ncbi:MAG: 30S ribosomal protein S1 [Flavobacteriales bacterium]|nr:30S ribosomal protein S1 [Flavobacteriales bacterium]
MAESKRVKAEEADEKGINENLQNEVENVAPEVEVTADVEEEVVAEEPLEIFSTADEKMYLTESGEFNWDAYEAAGGYNNDERKKLDKMYESTLSVIREREVVEGTVVSTNKKEVVVNIGYKSEGVIPAGEFRYNPDLKIGDKVPVFIEQTEDKNGQLNVSHKTARVFSAWGNVNRALESGEIIKGEVKSRTKGGLIVDVFGIEAFLPGSQIDVKPIRDYDQYVGKIMELKVVKINNEFKNVVVSHKALIEAELEEQKKLIMSGLEKGQVLEGIVKNITTYGVFVDLGGVDGLIHITDLSWGRVTHPEELVQLDSKINVVILDFDDDKKRIALGMKQLTAHPWDAIEGQLEVGQKVKGKVVVLADYGAFVEIAPGVEGLIHVSEMSWSTHLRSAQDFLKVGEEVECVILSVDKDERKLSLGMKQLTQDPWENIESRFPVTSKHKAKVRAFTNFGVFCELAEGIDGLIHISDLSWSKKIKHPSEFCHIGDELEVVVLELDKDNRRISLGHKQIEENPWDVFETVFVEGSKHQGTIVRKEGSHAIVALPYGLEGFCMNKNLKKADGSTAKVDETLEFIIQEFNKNQRKINVSHTGTWKEEEPGSAEAPKKAPRGGKKQGSGEGDSQAVKAVNAQVEKSTLGDLDVLANLKEKMEGDSKEGENQ